MGKVGFDCLVGKVSTLADGSVKVEVVTSKELSNEHAAVLLGLRRQEGYVLFASERIEEKDIPVIEPDPFKAPIGKKKSTSKNIRDHLYVLWKISRNKKTFDQFYEDYGNRQCEGIRDRIKEYEG